MDAVKYTDFIKAAGEENGKEFSSVIVIAAEEGSEGEKCAVSVVVDDPDAMGLIATLFQIALAIHARVAEKKAVFEVYAQMERARDKPDAEAHHE